MCVQQRYDNYFPQLTKHITADKNGTCIYVSGSVSYKQPKFKVKNKISGKYMAAVDVDQELTVEDANGDDAQLW